MTTEAAARLVRAADALQQGKLPQPDDAQFLAKGIGAALSGEAAFDVAFGLAPPPPLSAMAQANRAELVLKLAQFYDGAPSKRAMSMAEAAHQYATGSWPRIRNIGAPPFHHVGRPEAVLFRLHQSAESGAARWPLGWRSIFEILQSVALASAKGSAPQDPSWTRNDRS